MTTFTTEDSVALRNFLLSSTGVKLLSAMHYAKPSLDIEDLHKTAMTACKRSGFEEAIDLIKSLSHNDETTSPSDFLEDRGD